MSVFKKASAGLLCAAMTVSLSSCNLGGPDSSYAAVINGEKIPAGIFISFQQNAYYDAMDYVDPTAETTTTAAESGAETAATTPFSDKSIDGKPVRDWINDQATLEMQKYAAVEAKFDELGLTFSDNEPEKVQVYLDSIWDYYGEMYENYGISENSVKLITLNSEKESLIFNHIYGEGGTKAVSDDELKQYLSDNNARINYMMIELKDKEGNLLKSEGKAEMTAKAEEYIERAKNGEDFNAIIHEYQDSLTAEFSGINAVIGSTDGMEGAAETTAPEAETAEETTAASEGEEAETAETTAASEDHSGHSHTTVISKDGIAPDTAVVDKLFDGTAAPGDYFIVEATNGETLYVIQYLDLFLDETYFENNKENALQGLKGEEFDTEVEAWASAITVERNQAAYDRYTYEKFEE